MRIKWVGLGGIKIEGNSEEREERRESGGPNHTLTHTLTTKKLKNDHTEERCASRNVGIILQG